MEALETLFKNIGTGFISILPTSPFAQFIGQVGNLPYLSFLNWFLPIGTMLTIFSAWLGAVALFYLYSIVLRWLRFIS